MPLDNVYPSDHSMLSVRHLAQRGWSERMAEKYLGTPDCWLPVNHWRNYTGARAWALDRVERVEATIEFERSFLRGLNRRKVKLTEKEVAKILARLRRLRRIGRDSFPPIEASFRDRALAQVAETLKQLRAAGFRTPHK